MNVAGFLVSLESPRHGTRLLSCSNLRCDEQTYQPETQSQRVLRPRKAAKSPALSHQEREKGRAPACVCDESEKLGQPSSSHPFSLIILNPPVAHSSRPLA